MKFVLIAFALFVLGCACDNPRGCPAVIGVGNNSDEMQLRKDGRDDQSAQMAKMPAPPTEAWYARAGGRQCSKPE
ncbi:hypothetical protein [Fibrobacter succinogenes]|nr:hypothetical protein [Fibrobacter succinogenes]